LEPIPLGRTIRDRVSNIYQSFQSLGESRRTSRGGAFAYGEITFEALTQVILLTNIEPHSVMFDLGSGRGLAVIQTALTFPNLFSKCIGIEMISSLYHVSAAARDQLTDEEQKRVEFMQGDLFKVDWCNANLVFMAATCFDEGMMKSFACLAESKLKPGSKIISVSQKIPSQRFRVVHQDLYRMSWGNAQVYISELL
jgi:hypothetical protein